MTERVQMAIAIVFLIVLSISISLITVKIWYDYRINNSGIRVKLLGMIQIMFIHFHSIEKAQKLTVKEYFSSWIRNRETIFAPINRFWGPAILITRKGIFKKILITPDNVDELLAMISKRKNLES